MASFFFFDIYETTFNKKVNDQSLSIVSVDETAITDVQHRQIKVVCDGQQRSGVSNIGRKRNSCQCYHLCECQWNIRSVINGVLEKKYKRGGYGWSTGGINFVVTS